MAALLLLAAQSMRPAFISWKRNLWHVAPLCVVDAVGLVLLINLPVSLRLLDGTIYPSLTGLVWVLRGLMLLKALELRRRALAEHARTIGDRDTNRAYLDRVRAAAMRQMELDRAFGSGLSGAAAVGEPEGRRRHRVGRAHAPPPPRPHGRRRCRCGRRARR
jgi:hypothetical protein